MNINELKPINKLNPFTKFCCTIGNLPSSYLASMSYYEQLLWFCEFLEKTVIPSINKNAEAVQEIQNLLVELKNYVDNYFENLDVQEEINNKLDEMVENGTLEAIVANYLDFDVQDLLNFRIFENIPFSTTELYEGHSHSQLQGFTKIGNNLVFCLHNEENLDNYDRIVVYDTINKSILRSAYLQLYHANSIAFDEENEILYISATSTYINGVMYNNNRIICVDYNTLAIVNTIDVSNLPPEERIRSVTYDNENKKLYGANVTTLFEIDIENEVITNTIFLSSNNLNLYTTNQNIKVYKKWYVGLWLPYIVFWKKDGSIFRIINFTQYTHGVKVGEAQDLYIDETTGDITVASTKTINTVDTNRYALFSLSNIYTNNSNIPQYNLGGADTTPITIYVDNTNTGHEQGSQNYPFKKLQDAVNVAKNLGLYCRINVTGNSQDFTDIRGFKGEINFNSDLSIDGLSFSFCDIKFNIGNHAININGIQSIFSKFQLIGNNENCIINKLTKTFDNTGLNKCLYSLNSDIYISNFKFIGDNSANIIDVRQKTTLHLYECEFSNYTEKYAIFITSMSTVNLQRCVFNTINQSIFYVGYGAVLHGQNDYANLSYFTLYRGKVVDIVVNDDGFTDPVYYGQVTSQIHSEFDMIRFKIKCAGVNNAYKYFECPTSRVENVIESLYGNDNSVKHNFLYLAKPSAGGINLNTNRYITIANNGTYSYENITETPSSVTNYSGIYGIEYYNY